MLAPQCPAVTLLCVHVTLLHIWVIVRVYNVPTVTMWNVTLHTECVYTYT